jgi:hypothetical protein
MLIRTRCDHCQAVTEVSKVNLGQVLICCKCGGQYVALAHEDNESKVIALAEEEADVQLPTFEVRTGTRVTRHSLLLPAPPPEDWNLFREEDGETLPGGRFPRFRARRKELEPFLDRENPGADNAIFLIAGLVAFAVIGAISFALLLILCFFV